MCIYVHTRTHIYVSPPRRITSRPCTGSVILPSRVRDPGLWTVRGAEEIPEVRKVRRDIVSRRSHMLLAEFASIARCDTRCAHGGGGVIH